MQATRLACESVGALSVDIPGFPEPFSIVLSDNLATARGRALELHARFIETAAQQYRLIIPGLDRIDADTWSGGGADDEWLIWRARRSAERLARMPISIELDELIVGKPLLDIPGNPENHGAVAPASEGKNDAEEMLSRIPPFPGGDAGHFHPDFETLFEIGIGGIITRIEAYGSREGLTPRQATFYRACLIAVRGMARYTERVADECDRLAGNIGGEGATGRGAAAEALRLRESAAVCRRTASSPPATFREAIQLMFLTQISLWFGDDHPLTSPGRIDRTLRHFYEADLGAGRITRGEAFELICSRRG